MRLGELVWPDSVSLHSYRKVVLRRSLCINNSSYSFILPTHKTVTARHGCEILVSVFSTSVDPLPVMHHYVCSCNTLFHCSPELWLTSDARLPTRAWFVRRLHHPCGSEFTGHSMQARGTMTLVLLGIPPHIIQAIGRWSSDEWQKYIRKHAFLQQALLHGHPCRKL